MTLLNFVSDIVSNHFLKLPYSQLILNDLKIKQLKAREKIYRVADHSGLCIEIRPTGGKFWRYRYRVLTKPKMLTIGKYPEISLAYSLRASLNKSISSCAKLAPATFVGSYTSTY